jgi:UDPglucose 6-dehydrogenase
MAVIADNCPNIKVRYVCHGSNVVRWLTSLSVPPNPRSPNRNTSFSFVPSVLHDFQVTVLDLSQKQIDAWNSEKLPIYEPGLDEVVARSKNKNLFFSTDVDAVCEESDVIFISVNTPTKQTGIGAGRAANIKNCELAARNIARVSTKGKIIVEKSTVPVRTAQAVSTVLANNDKGLKFQVLSNPEFLAEGTAVDDLQNPGRVLIGGMQNPEGLAAIETLVSVYEHWVPR